jgi:four helix bundle protein
MTGSADLRTRTSDFALAVIRFYSGLPREAAAQVLGRQVLRSATSVGAQYREARRGKSAADFVSKCEGALQELEETAYWLELLERSTIATGAEIKRLRGETDQLLSIFVSLVRRAKQNSGRPAAWGASREVRSQKSEGRHPQRGESIPLLLRRDPARGG